MEDNFKCITFDKEAQDAIPKHIKMKMEADKLLARLKQALPKHADVRITNYNGSEIGKGHPCVEVKCYNPELSDSDFEICKQFMRDILGERLMEFYTEETGCHWFAYLKNPETKEDKKRKLDAAFEIMSGGIMYKPQGCKMDGDKKRYKNGCGKCGTGNYNQCDWP